jgi:23S rRNA pseudouridine2605 synthase
MSAKNPTERKEDEEERRDRLQKYLAQAGISSRRSAEKLILAGRVSINHKTVTELGRSIILGKDVVAVDGKVVAPQKKHLYAFHKPEGVVCTMRDPQGRKCMRDYLDCLPQRVYPVGRLDVDATGLLLVTNDGEYAAKLLHPRYGAERTYWAMVRGNIGISQLRALVAGVKLEDGPGRAFVARQLRCSKRTASLLGRLPTEGSLVELIVAEGRKHFVKRLLSCVGHPVIKLCRIAHGPFSLGNLKPGEIKEVKNYEEY